MVARPAADPGPGGAPLKAAKTTAGSGGPARRTPETCIKAGVPSRASGPTSSSANKGDKHNLKYQTTYPEKAQLSDPKAKKSTGTVPKVRGLQTKPARSRPSQGKTQERTKRPDSALKSVNATAASPKGGAAGRGADACELAGAINPSSSSSTPALSTTGEAVILKPPKALAKGELAAGPEEKFVSSLLEPVPVAVAKDVPRAQNLTEFFADLTRGANLENLQEGSAGGGSLPPLPPPGLLQKPPRQPSTLVVSGADVSLVPEVSKNPLPESVKLPPSEAPDEALPHITADLAGERRSVVALAEQFPVGRAEELLVGLRGTVSETNRWPLPRKEASSHLSTQPTPSPKIAAPSPSKSSSINYRRNSKNTNRKSIHKVA
ncbi:nascent polypeptide-associated complex subunit alpha, muscle-specific form-like [Neocloeon triangulifer]|uniref:nascent polypeptide-associated complex subunit alpha, muscle-specific form-like n=1 Tax=Neocloeon triangulifer TaxID=2078957 RepID=UPI00286F9492|nr:nascent polypeptide-associated complex subunit alpha, muscle-specific form-like [Neocloeon triangulifer]